jgi:hypothetical protein
MNIRNTPFEEVLMDQMMESQQTEEAAEQALIDHIVEPEALETELAADLWEETAIQRTIQANEEALLADELLDDAAIEQAMIAAALNPFDEDNL